jgi:hypothetical protein
MKSKKDIITSSFDRKTIRLINFIMIIIALLVIVLTPFFQSIWFYVRHIVIFVIIAFLLCFNGYFIGKKFMKKHPIKARTLKVVTLGMLFIGLVLFSNLQLFYIQNYEIPPLLGCSYYDDHGNLIYNSQIAGSCPKLENLVKNQLENGNELSFSVHEEIFRVEDDLFEDHVVDQKYYYDSQIEYKYDSLQRVIYYDINLIISGFTFDEDLQDYKLFKKTEYRKNVENIYETNKLISNHKVVNTVTHEDDIVDSYSSYENDIQYISELFTEDSSNYLIEIKKTINNDSGVETNLLYTMDVNIRDDNYFYIVNKVDKDEYLVLSVEERDAQNDWYVIKKDYRSSVYDQTRTEKEEYFEYHKSLSDSKQKIFTNDFTRDNPYIATDVDFDDTYILRTHEDGAFSQGFFNFTNIIEDTDYGFKINHYHTQRDNDLSYNTYNQTISYSIDYPNNNLSIELQSINNYERSLYYPNFYTFELVYQDNPFLMRTYIDALKN